MLGFIQISPYIGRNIEHMNKSRRRYLFPYRIGDKLTSNAGNCLWYPDNKDSLQTNLPAELDVFAVQQKLLRLGDSIRERGLRISNIQTTWFEDDILEVFLDDKCPAPTETFKQLDSLVSCSFGLPIKL